MAGQTHKNNQFFKGQVQFASDVSVPADLAGATTSMFLVDPDTGTIVNVTLGTADSGGSGLRALSVPN